MWGRTEGTVHGAEYTGVFAQQAGFQVQDSGSSAGSRWTRTVGPVGVITWDAEVQQRRGEWSRAFEHRWPLSDTECS